MECVQVGNSKTQSGKRGALLLPGLLLSLFRRHRKMQLKIRLKVIGWLYRLLQENKQLSRGELTRF